MDIELIGQITVAVLGMVAAGAPLISRRNRKSLRENLAQDVSIMNQLDTSSPAYRMLANHVDREVAELTSSMDKRRDPLGIGLGLGFIVVGAAGAIIAIGQGDNWLYILIPSGLVFLLGSAGFSQDVSRVKRDDKGNPIKDD